MTATNHWTKLLVIGGMAGMLVGAVDPLEGSPLVFVGAMLVAIGALVGHSRYRTLIYWAFWLTALGIAVIWGLTWIGGIGEDTDRSIWWGLLALPYPVGWLIGLVGAVLRLREKSADDSLPVGST